MSNEAYQTGGAGILRGRRGIYTQILALRREIGVLAATRPLTDPEVVRLSRRLDQLVLRLMSEQRTGEPFWLEDL